MLKKLASFTGWLLVLTLSLIFCFTFGLWLNWHTPAIILFWLMLLLLSSVLSGACYALKNLLCGKKGHRWLEKYRLSRREYVLLTHWKRGANIIKRIRRQQSPLPWYVLIGNRCGKSTLLASAGVPHFDDENSDIIAAPTRTLHWWFFRHLCVLDLSSNFLSGDAAMRQAWRKLMRWCMRLPAPTGIIVAMPIGALMSNDLSALHVLMRQHRALIEPLIHRYGEGISLSVLVTQCDNFPGFSLWCRQLSDAQRQQPLGYCWPTPPHIDGQDEQALHPLFSAIKTGMARTRLSMGRPSALSEQDYAMVLDFPDTFATLESKLRYALASLCEPNAYFSHTRLNSIWFCASEPHQDNLTRREGVFIHKLLSGHLRELSLHQGIQRWYQRPRAKFACSLLSALCAIWIVYSAWLTFGRLQPDVAQMSADNLADFLAHDERYSSLSLAYLPFQPLLNKQHRQAEWQLLSLPSLPRLITPTTASFRQRFMAAPARQQREMILQLTHAILVWQKMRRHTTLDALHNVVPIAIPLQQRDYPATLSPLTVMALERGYIRRPEGAIWLQRARNLLEGLVNQDQTLSWLLAADSRFPDLQAARFWPALPDNLALNGRWTQAGQTTLSSWMSQIENAVGHPVALFHQAAITSTAQRQDAWKLYLIDLAAHLQAMTPATMPLSRLVALGQNQSQAMQFVAHCLQELQDIPGTQAQPWLLTLRQLHQLALDSQSAGLLHRVSKVDQQVRRSFIAWLKKMPSPATKNRMQADNHVWLQWLNARNSAVAEAVAQGKLSPDLTRGLFNPQQQAATANPLSTLLPALVTLQEQLTPQNTDAGIAAVWQLYQDDAHHLLGHAMAQSACWLNSQWKSTVIWPLNNSSTLHSYEEQQTQSKVLVNAFLLGPAKAFLVNGTDGQTAADYAGMPFPLSASFIDFLRHASSPEMMQDVPQRPSTLTSDRRTLLQGQRDALIAERSALENARWGITVSSLPATVPGGASVLPIGTALTLHCQKGDQQLSSMNFADQQNFDWQPGHCSGVSLKVFFPDFTASYQLVGDNAWPYFLRHLSNGEMRLDSDEFFDNAALLHQLRIENILVRFTLSSPQQLESAWRHWREISRKIAAVDAQIAGLDSDAETVTFNPLSALPEDIAQCQ
ncbi:hypothetical protein BL250_14475 [Erwinia sp. OLTSP20]|uniref:type VI secretion protein IcmF/TssM N-terminal domain-containing protein n=1 Tax=unclassified Erwinia TaxID=2622719 RepID=UPI000C179303|nr:MULTISPECIES: type VI secretion protein IcmF/TssM N-terminal domain-containing protein [unclassified Erwinia]PIJ48252.1 hypothetical protein BV501_17865 [Erwinia sp. OAMSP11]PIJ68752.1 hypothetical protein BK416_16155 [Erwinia sp. OLSSP12]PIJ78927.1 hypothetical protein BLD47_16070 [Erwinia sp. OLCASP19]PIJ79537.1 hypothetical protein BLD46_16865 [Erwinia sp. OLMTSP26]PIJ81495.1 hypothetical protein BLD49_16475 [Erwinia sp. OLMDSP33]